MQLEIGNLGGEDLRFILPGATAEASQAVSVRQLKALRGLVQSRPGQLVLSGVSCERGILQALRLVFGSVVLEALHESELACVRAEYASGSPPKLELQVQTLRSERLCVRAGTVTVQAQTVLRGARLDLAHGLGTVSASEADFVEFELMLGTLRFAAPALRVRDLMVGWGGEAGFRLSAEHAQAAQGTVQGGAAAFQAADVEARQLDLAAGVLKVAALSAAQSDASWPLAPPHPGPAAHEIDAQSASETDRDASAQSAAGVNYAFLDGASGHVHVDAVLEMAVPVIGRRRARHRIRAPIRQGALDFRRLERDLSTLEDALLDFSVRDRTLVLELGIPLIPTRGRGRPLVRWQLSDDDVVLAENNRARLAVLARPQRSSSKEAPGQEAGSTDTTSEARAAGGVYLRSLGLANLDIRLALEQTTERPVAAVRRLSVAELAVQGELRYERDAEPRDGRLQAQLRGLLLELDGLPLGHSSLSCDELSLHEASDVQVDFRGLRPQTVRWSAAGLGLRRVRFG